MTILVTGAAGNVGAELVGMLLADGRSVRALSRSKTPSGIPAGAEIVTGDLADRRSLAGAISGIDAAFLLAGYPDLPGILADLRAAGAGRVVLLSSGAVDNGDPDNYVVHYNAESESALRESELGWTILRPSGFMSNTLQWRDQLAAGNQVAEPFADVPIAVVDPSDIAAVAALSLTTGGYHGRSYRLTGPESLLPTDRARILGRVLGRDIELIAEPDDQARERMSQDMPEPMVDAFFQFFRRGGYDDSRVDPTLPSLLGRPAHDFTLWARQHTDDFR
jgi:uncharacterized protein YbjT (DUF2867 family)